MRKAASRILATTLLLAALAPAAQALELPNNYNPQQAGHIAYLEATQGEEKAKETLKEYKEPAYGSITTKDVPPDGTRKHPYYIGVDDSDQNRLWYMVQWHNPPKNVFYVITANGVVYHVTRKDYWDITIKKVK